MFRAHCVKRRELDRPRLRTGANYYSGGVGSPPCSTLQLKHQELCTAEAQEMQNLIKENGTSQATSATALYLDTKVSFVFLIE